MLMGVGPPLSLAALLVLLTVAVPGAAGGLPVEVFRDSFLFDYLDPSKWTTTSGAPLVDTASENPPSPPYALHLRGPGATIESRPFDLSGYASGVLVVSWERGGRLDPPEPGDNVTISANLASGFQPLAWLDGAPANLSFSDLVIPLPAEAFHAGFFIGIRNTGQGSNNDHWFLDDIRVVAEALPEAAPWTPIAFGALGAAVTALAVYATRYRTVIEEIFLINRAGVLIRHATRRLRPDFDHDVMGGMLTAVQAFVQDSFRAKGELNEITYGQMKILIEGGEHLMLAAVLSRGFRYLFRRRMRVALDAIEREFAGVLAGWDGDVHKFRDADRFLEELLVGAT